MMDSSCECMQDAGCMHGSPVHHGVYTNIMLPETVETFSCKSVTFSSIRSEVLKIVTNMTE
jgi:hypothetical protein